MIPPTSRDALESAMQRFDQEFRETPEWQDWESNANYRHALEHEGRSYPVKTIISVDGVVLRLVKEAKGPGPHILLIDEINRANLPKVLGELMYLFEYRDQVINLRFTPDFSLPNSLRFIGTMNTADRSIRSIDTALRRRFDIWECPPNPSILDRYYMSHNSEVANLVHGFADLNARLTEELDRHHTIGHTFFLADRFTRARLASTWEHKIRPLIEEYFFDAPTQASTYTLDAFWPEAV